MAATITNNADVPDGYPVVSTSAKALKRYLTPELWTKLKNTKTKYGAPLELVIKSGLEEPKSQLGIFATDPDAYVTFSDLILPMIRDIYLPTNKGKLTQPPRDYGDVDDPLLDLSTSDPEGRYIVSSRVRLGRNLAGFPFSTFINRQERQQVADLVRGAVNQLPRHLQGRYRNLVDIDTDEKRRLVAEHVLYKDHDVFLSPAGVYRDWPSGRALFMSASGDLHLWVNEEDHVRVISMATEAKLGALYKIAIEAVEHLERHLEMSYDQQLGYLTLCPSNLGTALRSSVHMRLPRVSTLSSFSKLCDELGLEVRGTHGENTNVVDCIYDISNKRRFGLTENEAIHQVAHGIRVLLLIEQGL